MNEWEGFWGKFNTRDFHYLYSLILLWWIFYYHKKRGRELEIPNIRACLSQQCHEHDVVFAWVPFSLFLSRCLEKQVQFFILYIFKRHKKKVFNVSQNFQFLKQQLANHKWISTSSQIKKKILKWTWNLSSYAKDGEKSFKGEKERETCQSRHNDYRSSKKF